MKLSFGSLFSGVGGMDLGFLRNDWECKWMVEFDKNAAGVLAHHYPDVPLHCDVEKVDADELEVPDVVCAGFPCQDVSIAGLRKGLHEGTRSSLLWNAIRILRRLRARGNLRYALFENVPGLFSIDNGLGFARCIRELLSIGCGDVGWTILDAKDVGWCTSDGRRVRSVPQRRRRIFICASFGDTGEATAREIFSFSSRMSRNTEKGGEEGEGTPANITEGAGGGGGEGVVDVPTFSDGTQTASSLTTRSHDQFMPDKGNFSAVIQPQGVDVYNGQVTGEVAASVTAATGISNATGPKVMSMHETGKGFWKKADHSGCLRAEGENRPSRPSNVVCSWNGDITPKSAEDVSVTLRAQQGGEGTGVAHQKIISPMHDPAPALDASYYKGCGERGGIERQVLAEGEPTGVRQNMVVRRLTPKETCRLQAWEDDRLDVREVLELDGNLWIATGKQVEQADSAKYRQAGNGVASNCSEWIARRMRHVLER